MLLQVIFLLMAAIAAPPVVIRDGGQFPQGWVVIQQPQSETEWRCANYSSLEWTVSGHSARSASVSSYEYTAEIRFALPDGELIGTNLGEFGGKIEWAARDAERLVLVPDKNPVAFTKRGDDVFVATGLSHLSLDFGEIIRLRRMDAGAWQVSTVMGLDKVPNAAARIDDDTWLILTSNGVTKVDLLNFTKEQVYRNDNWRMIYTNSIHPLGNSWLVGARRAVLRISPENGSYTEEWLAPADCKTLSGPNCECAP